MSEKPVYLPPMLLGNNSSPTNYKQFKAQLEKKIKRKIKKFVYQDEEGDLVSITNDLEFQELFRGLSFRGLSEERINLLAVIDGTESVEVHSAFCDSCGGTIVGIRYKCANCADYDLCDACESVNGVGGSIHPKDHLFLKVYRGLNPKYPHCILPNFYKEESFENSAIPPEIQGRLTAVERQLSQIVSQLAPKDQVQKPKPVNFEKAREERKSKKMLRREARRKDKEEARQGAWRCDLRRQREMQEKKLQERIAEEAIIREAEEEARRKFVEEARRIEEEEARRIEEEEAIEIDEEAEEERRIKEEEERRIKEEKERKIKEAEELERKMKEEEEEEERRRIKEDEERKIKEAEEEEERRMQGEEEKMKEKEERRMQEEKIDPKMEQFLAMLSSMGFTDRSLNLSLLEEHQADVALVIEELLG